MRQSFAFISIRLIEKLFSVFENRLSRIGISSLNVWWLFYEFVPYIFVGHVFGHAV